MAALCFMMNLISFHVFPRSSGGHPSGHFKLPEQILSHSKENKILKKKCSLSYILKYTVDNFVRLCTFFSSLSKIVQQFSQSESTILHESII